MTPHTSDAAPACALQAGGLVLPRGCRFPTSPEFMLLYHCRLGIWEVSLSRADGNRMYRPVLMERLSG